MKADFVSALEQREERGASRSNRKAVEAIRAKMNMNVSLGPVERLDEVASADLWAKLLLKGDLLRPAAARRAQTRSGVGCILPTVTHSAHSPQGRATARL